MFGFFLGLGDDFLARPVQFLHFRLIACDGFLHLLLALADGLAFVFPIALVAHDVLQVFVRVDVVAPHDGGGIGYYILGQAYFAGDLYGKRASGITYLELEERLHQVSVVEHGAVDHSLVVLGKMLQVLIVGGDDAKRPLLVETAQHRLGYGSTDLRLGASSELVDQYQAPLVAVLHHDFHVGQVRGIGAQLVFDGLLVADVDEDAFEDAGPAALVHRDEQPALQHVLQEAHRLQTHGFAARIGSGYDEDALLPIQLDVQRYHLLAMLGQGDLQERMYGRSPVNDLPVLQCRPQSGHALGQQCLGANEVYFSQEFV